MAINIKSPNTPHINFTGQGFLSYARRYRNAAIKLLSTPPPDRGFDPVPYFLLCMSLESQLKSFIWLRTGLGREKFAGKYGHDIEKLWNRSKDLGIHRYAKVTPVRDTVISIVGPHYKDRKFHYLTVSMIVNGYTELDTNPNILPTLKKLTGQLEKSLQKPVTRASVN